MKRADLSTEKALNAIYDHWATDARNGFDLLCDAYPWKIVWRKFERLDRQGYLDYGVSLRCAWLTEKGLRFIDKPQPQPRTPQHIQDAWDKAKQELEEKLGPIQYSFQQLYTRFLFYGEADVVLEKQKIERSCE